MVENLRSESELLPPKRWHDAIRNNFPGVMVNPDCFESFTQIEAHGLQYIIVSISKNDPNMKAPEGIYVETNIPLEKTSQAMLYIDNLLTKLTVLFCKDGPAESKAELPVEIKDKVAEPGVFVDLGNTINVEVYGATGQNMLVFSLKPIGINEFNAKINKSLEYPGSYTINKFK